MKRILLRVITIVLLLSITVVIASAATINDSSVFIKQSQSGWCTWASVAMMMRRNAILDGNPYWDSITDSTIHYSGGLRFDFTSCGYRIICKTFSSCTSDNKSYLISMLNSHPEGVVCYMYSNDGSLKTHAVLVTDYNASEDMFYCADPASGYWGRKIKVTDAYLTGSTSNQVVNNFKQFWYISSGSCNLTSPLGTAQSTTYYTITLKGNGGSSSSNTIKSSAGSKISLPTPIAPEGYEFNGWFTSASSGTYVSSGNNYTVNGNSTLYAQWRPITYDVNYDANGGSGAPNYQVKTYGESLTLSYTKPTREGYSFLGWSLSSSASVASYKAGDTYNGNADLTLYAVWKALPPTVTASKTSVYLDYDTNKSETITLTVNGQLPDTYHLNVVNNSELVVSWGDWNGRTVGITISATEKSTGSTDLVITLRDQNDTVYAKTMIKVLSSGKYCTINYDANGGYNAPDSHKVPYDLWGETSRVTTDIPKRDGYTFIGWSTNPNDVLPDYGFDYRNIVLQNDVTLYAIWHKTEFSIIINRNLNGGTGTDEQKIININLDNYKVDSYNYSSPRIEISSSGCGVYIDNSTDVFPVKEGYIFNGWKGRQKGLDGFYIHTDWKNDGYDIYNKAFLYIGFDYGNEITLTAEWIKEKWNGEVADSFGGGIGTEEEPYVIENVSQMAKLSYDVAAGTSYENSYFELINDIDMKSNATWLPIGYNSNSPFKGNFNGNNYRIYNFCVESNSSDYKYTGLFGYCKDAKIENIVFERSKVTPVYGGYVGTLVGYIDNCTIQNINTLGTDVSFKYNGNIYIGDMVGCASNGSVINGCYSDRASISVSANANIFAGGIVGKIFNSYIGNCCTNQPIIMTSGSYATHWIGGISGYLNNGSKVEDCLSVKGYFYGDNDSSYTYVGGIVGENDGDIVKCMMNSCSLNSIGVFGSYAGGIVGMHNGYISDCMSVKGDLYSKTNNDEGMVERYECVGPMIAGTTGSTGVNNYYDSNTDIRHGINKCTYGSARTLSELISKQSSFVKFSSFSDYENGKGTLWNKASDEFATIYKTSDFKTIKILPVENGAISTDVSRAAIGAVINITAIPNAGYHLEKIYINGEQQSDISKFIVTGNSIITPVFELDENPLFNIYASKCDNGVVLLNTKTAYPGDTVTITTIPDDNYILDAILVDGSEISGNSFVVTTNHIVTARFKEKNYTITANNQEEGEIILDKTKAKYGEVIKVTVVSNDGYRLDKILVDGKEINGDTFIVSGNHNVSCEWISADVMYTIDVQNGEKGIIEVDSTISRKGSIIVVYVIPNDGYKLEQIYVNDKAIAGNMFVLLDNSVVTAKFSSLNDDRENVTGVSLNKTSVTLTVGNKETLIATVLPTTATNKNISWSSSNTSVATVDDGVVTAVGPGTATITVTTEQWSYVADCTVTVTSIIDENSPVIKVNNSKGYIGKTVDIVINVENNPGIAILGFNVNYDKSAMTLKSATLGEIFSGELECNIASVPFVFNVYSGSENKTNDGKLVTLQFEIKPDCAEGDYAISLSDIEALNIAENDVHFDAVNGTITVTNSIPGDVTGDGKVTRGDLLRLAKSFSGFEVEMDMAAADVTGDGKVTRGDLLRLAKHFSGFDVELGK